MRLNCQSCSFNTLEYMKKLTKMLSPFVSEYYYVIYEVVRGLQAIKYAPHHSTISRSGVLQSE